ncbi:hypothetical protein ACJX0J_031527 [Zea mays]
MILYIYLDGMTTQLCAKGLLYNINQAHQKEDQGQSNELVYGQSTVLLIKLAKENNLSTIYIIWLKENCFKATCLMLEGYLPRAINERYLENIFKTNKEVIATFT